LIKPDWVRRGQIILALSNPVPEIDPEAAVAAGAAFAADGKSVNNVLGFLDPARAVDTDARCISHEMYLQLPDHRQLARPKSWSKSLDKSVHQAVARAVARQLSRADRRG